MLNEYLIQNSYARVAEHNALTACYAPLGNVSLTFPLLLVDPFNLSRSFGNLLYRTVYGLTIFSQEYEKHILKRYHTVRRDISFGFIVHFN